MNDDRDEFAEWTPTRGRKTQAAAWLILAVLAGCMILMIAAIAIP